MRRLLFVALAALLTVGTSSPIIARQHPAKVAPADEYFGRLKMSILGVRNELKDLQTRVALNPDRSGDQMGAALMVEDAIRDWEHKYPQDSWLAKSVYQLSQLYSSIRTPQAQARAAIALRWLVVRYPSSVYAASARTQISSFVTK